MHTYQHGKETKAFYISDISWPAMVLEDNYFLQWQIAAKKLSLKMELICECD